MNENKNTEEYINLDSKEILDLLKSERGPGRLEERETNRQFYSGILNYKLSEKTESLTRKIFWLNVILVVLTFVLVANIFI